MPGRYLLITFLLLLITITSGERHECYSCSGVCHNEPCNCQMGSCESGQCFIEKKPTEIPGSMKITKGCLRRTSRIHHGCEYDHFSDHILCVCQGRYCNDKIVMNTTTRTPQKPMITCRECSEKQPDCDGTCQGHWCHEDMATGAAGCGYGPPALPFYYRGPELFYYRNKVCITMSRGAGKPRRHCICSTNMCNTVYNYRHLAYIKDKDKERESSMRSRSLALSATDYTLPLQTCYNCETNTQDATAMSHTTNCRSNRCLGHYCTYAAQRHTSRNTMGRVNMVHAVSELQGCMNVSDKSHIQLGCSKKWISDEYEELHCACRGNLCNSDSLTAGCRSDFAAYLIIFQFFLYLFLS